MVSQVNFNLKYCYFDLIVKVRSHIGRADVGRVEGKIGFNTNHYMRSSVCGYGAGTKSALQQLGPTPNFLHPLWNRTLQFHLCPQQMADRPMSAPHICEHTRSSRTGMSKLAHLCSATALRICECSLSTAFLYCFLLSLYPDTFNARISRVRINSLWPSDVIWWQGSRSTLAQVMAWCLTAPSHYPNQCWLIIIEVQWYSY